MLKDADPEMTAQLWLGMLEDIGNQYHLSDAPFSLMQKLSHTAKASVDDFLKKQAEKLTIA